MNFKPATLSIDDLPQILDLIINYILLNIIIKLINYIITHYIQGLV